MTGYFAQAPRALSPDDHVPARVLLMGALGVTPYIDRAMEVLQLAERGHDHEHRALVIARDGTVAALALYGAVGGALGVSKIHAAIRARHFTSAEAVGGREVQVQRTEEIVRVVSRYAVLLPGTVHRSPRSRAHHSID